MGITGLLSALQPASVNVHIASLAGKSVAVDSYCWLHKGAYGCALELVQGRKTDLYVRYCMRRVAMLLHHKVTPIMVFDGAYLPSKAGKEDSRQERRDKYRNKGMALLRAGNRSKAIDCFQKCVDVTPEMALELMKACEREGVKFIVAPYEADAQLAYLANSGLVHAVITEDSDLLLYSCKRLIFKLDQFGNGQQLNFDRIRSQFSDDPNAYCFANWDLGRIRQMCILAGCDYLPSLSGMGLKTAYKYFKKYKCAAEVLRTLQGSSQFRGVNAEYIQMFKQAEHTFLYQLVWCPFDKCLKPVTPYPADLDPSILHFAGPQVARELAEGIAMGRVNPLTSQPFEGLEATFGSDLLSKSSPSHEAIFAKYGRPYDPSGGRISDGLVQTNTMKNYIARVPSSSSSCSVDSTTPTLEPAQARPPLLAANSAGLVVPAAPRHSASGGMAGAPSAQSTFAAWKKPVVTQSKYFFGSASVCDPPGSEQPAAPEEAGPRPAPTPKAAQAPRRLGLSSRKAKAKPVGLDTFAYLSAARGAPSIKRRASAAELDGRQPAAMQSAGSPVPLAATLGQGQTLRGLFARKRSRGSLDMPAASSA